MAQTDNIKLKRLVKMVKALNERLQYLSYYIKKEKNMDISLKNKITEIENTIE